MQDEAGEAGCIIGERSIVPVVERGAVGSNESSVHLSGEVSV